MLWCLISFLEVLHVVQALGFTKTRSAPGVSIPCDLDIACSSQGKSQVDSDENMFVSVGSISVYR